MYRSAMPGIVTGILLALARISGETAPLLFTAFGNQYWSADVTGPMASVPVVMYQFAGSPYTSWQEIAWAGALVLTGFVLLISLVARAIVSRKRVRSEEHTSELQSLMRSSYAVFCLKQKKNKT